MNKQLDATESGDDPSVDGGEDPQREGKENDEPRRKRKERRLAEDKDAPESQTN